MTGVWLWISIKRHLFTYSDGKTFQKGTCVCFREINRKCCFSGPELLEWSLLDYSTPRFLRQVCPIHISRNSHCPWILDQVHSNPYGEITVSGRTPCCLCQDDPHREWLFQQAQGGRSGSVQFETAKNSSLSQEKSPCCVYRLLELLKATLPGEIWACPPLELAPLQLRWISVLNCFMFSPQTEVASRVLAVCKAFDKIAADQLNIDSHFIKVEKQIKMFENAIICLLKLQNVEFIC